MRILLAGTGSGCGKTTASILVMAVLRQMGLQVAPYKTGPDYIDPGFHRAVCGHPSHNLDTWLMEDRTIFRLLHHEADIAVIEGVMGYYDGLDPITMRCSTWELAQKTKSPVILVVDASGGAASVAAAVFGFLHMIPENGIAGVLVNRVSRQRHYELIRDAVRHYSGLPCVGYLEKQQDLRLSSRHLGLIPVEELSAFREKINGAVDAASRTLDIDRLLDLASRAPKLPSAEPEIAPGFSGYRLGVAMDKAFHFYYQDNLDSLTRSGMELCCFSPLEDEHLPADLDGLYIGGGYPEVFAEALAANLPMKTEIHTALAAGLPCYAECGGLMLLGKQINDHPMTDFLPVSFRMGDRLHRFGYTIVHDRTGLEFPAHEFHYAQPSPAPDACFAYSVRKASQPDRIWQCGYEREHTLGTFAHVHFGDRPELIRRFFA